jgi:hypothetical protein
VNVFVWHEVFPDYHVRMAATSQAIYFSIRFSEYLTLIPKE